MWRITATLALLLSGYAGAQSKLTERLRVARGTANVRVHPSTRAEIVALIVRDSDIHVDSVGEHWSRVRLQDGTPGYVATRLLGPSNEPSEWRTILYVSFATALAAILAALVSRRRTVAPVASIPTSAVAAK